MKIKLEGLCDIQEEEQCEDDGSLSMSIGEDEESLQREGGANHFKKQEYTTP